MSKLRCWPGCIAIIYNIPASSQLACNNGKTVQVLELQAGSTCNWRVESPQPIQAQFPDGIKIVQPGAKNLYCADHHLLPLTPPADTITENEVRELYQPSDKEKDHEQG